MKKVIRIEEKGIHYYIVAAAVTHIKDENGKGCVFLVNGETVSLSQTSIDALLHALEQ